MSEEKKFYKCNECKSIYAEKVEECEGCREKDFEVIDKITIEDIVNIIRDFPWRDSDNYSKFDDTAQYWDVFNYVNEMIGEQVYSDFDKALKLASEIRIAEKVELIYFPD